MNKKNKVIETLATVDTIFLYLFFNKKDKNNPLIEQIDVFPNDKTALANILKENEVASGSTEFIAMQAKKNNSPFGV